jgi:hypothetical protein
MRKIDAARSVYVLSFDKLPQFRASVCTFWFLDKWPTVCEWRSEHTDSFDPLSISATLSQWEIPRVRAMLQGRVLEHRSAAKNVDASQDLRASRRKCFWQ